jgi:hypothetical protein
MNSPTSSLLIAAFGLSAVVTAGATPSECPGAGTTTYVPNYTSQATFQKIWPSMVAQSVPDRTKIFCAKPDPITGAQSGALQLQLPFPAGASGFGTLQHVANVQSSSQVYWVPSAPGSKVGDYQGTVTVILHLDPALGGGTIPLTYRVENYIDENGNTCLASRDGAQQPGTDTFDFGSAMMWYIIKRPNGLYVDGTTFFIDSLNLNPDGTAKNFAYFRNAIADPAQFPFLAPTNIPNEFLEVYYTQMNTNDCNIQ